MELNLGGKVAIVTGGTQGIGLATAQLLAREGAAVVIVARGKERLESAAASIRAAGGRVAAVAADVGRPEDAARIVAAAIEAFGRLDILVNNAGTSSRGDFESVTDETWQADFDLKLFGDQHRERGLHPLAGFRRLGDDGHGTSGGDADEGVGREGLDQLSGRRERLPP